MVIAHSERHQELFKRKLTCFGVQMEVARLVSSERTTWDGISISSLCELTGDNRTSAPLVEDTLLGREMALEYKEKFAEEISAKVVLIGVSLYMCL